jgi:hypothetical protein
MKTRLSLMLLLFIVITSIKAQNVISGKDCTTATIEKIIKAAGIEVLESQPGYLKIIQDKDLKIFTFIDVDADKQYLIFNGSALLKAETTPLLAKALVSDMNTQTNFIKAGYDEEKNLIDFRYYFWIKDGFTEQSLISALDMYRLTFMYAFTVDKNDLLK